MNLTEKVAYLKGLTEGLKLDKDADTTKVINAIIDVLDEMALTVTDIDEDLSEVEEYVDELDEALADIEDEVYCDDDCCCCDDDEDEMYEVACPSCGEKIYIDESMFEEDFIECPSCGEKLELDIDFDDCDCDCGCCDDE